LLLFFFYSIGFQLLAIDQIDKNEQFSEIYDFRNAPRQSRAALQPTDIGWNPNDGKDLYD
jgi:hypothetical protein